MIKTKLIVNTAVSSAFLLMLLSANIQSAELTLVTDDGREILLKDNGSWQYRSTDRFASTSDGRRVRLKEDGTWLYDGNAALQSKQQVRTTDLDIKLQKVVVEKYQKKVQKNTRVKTQTVFYLSLTTSAQAKANLTIKADDISQIEVKDNNGKSYKVLSMLPHKTIEPGSETALIIRAEKSPGLLDGVKFMKITFKPDIFGLKNTTSFSQRTADFENENVAAFD